jgi:hypothetical protein
MASIPTIIHHMWISSDPAEVNIEEAPAVYRTNVNTFATNNPTYTHKFWNISLFADLLSSNVLLDPFKNIWYTLTNDYSRYMFALYCILYVQGGVYFRLDKVCLQSLHDLLTGKSNVVVFNNNSGVDLSQLGCLAESPLMRKVVQQFALNVNISDSDQVRFGGHMVYNVLRANPSLFNASTDPISLANIGLYLTTNNTPSQVVVSPHHHHHHHADHDDESWDLTLTVIGGVLLFGLAGIAVIYAMKPNGMKSKAS